MIYKNFKDIIMIYKNFKDIIMIYKTFNLQEFQRLCCLIIVLGFAYYLGKNTEYLDEKLDQFVTSVDKT